MNVQSMRKRIEALDGGTDEEDHNGCWLVLEKGYLPEEATDLKFAFHEPMLPVRYCRIKNSYFRAILNAVDGSTRTAICKPHNAEFWNKWRKEHFTKTAARRRYSSCNHSFCAKIGESRARNTHFDSKMSH